MKQNKTWHVTQNSLVTKKIIKRYFSCRIIFFLNNSFCLLTFIKLFYTFVLDYIKMNYEIKLQKNILKVNLVTTIESHKKKLNTKLSIIFWRYITW